MKSLVFLCLLLLSIGAGAQVRIENDVVLGLTENEEVAYSGKAENGCFVITMPAGADRDYDKTPFTLYDGACSGILKNHGAPSVMKFRDGKTLTFNFNYGKKEDGRSEFDVILISKEVLYKRRLVETPFDLRRFKKALP